MVYKLFWNFQIQDTVQFCFWWCLNRTKIFLLLSFLLSCWFVQEPCHILELIADDLSKSGSSIDHRTLVTKLDDKRLWGGHVRDLAKAVAAVDLLTFLVPDELRRRITADRSALQGDQLSRADPRTVVQPEDVRARRRICIKRSTNKKKRDKLWIRLHFNCISPDWIHGLYMWRW